MSVVFVIAAVSVIAVDCLLYYIFARGKPRAGRERLDAERVPGGKSK